jgi:hypothetical protein
MLAYFQRIEAKVLVFILAACLLGGCAASTPNVSQDVALGKDEGLLITRIHTNWQPVGIFIAGGDAPDSYMAKLSGPDGELKVIPLKAGRAYFSSIVRYGHPYNYRVKLEPSYFYIAPGAVTYVGDLFIDWKAEGGLGAGRTSVKLVDKEETTVNEAKTRYPWVFKKFVYRKSSSAIKGEGVENPWRMRPDLQIWVHPKTHSRHA